VSQSVVQGKSVSMWFRESESVCGSGKVSYLRSSIVHEYY